MKKIILAIAAVGVAFQAVCAAEKNPETAAELNRFYADPGISQNAALHIGPACQKVQITAGDRGHGSLPVIGKGKVPPGGEALNLPLRAAINEWVKRNEPAYAELLPILKLSGSRYPIDLLRGSDTPLPHLTQVKKGSQAAELFALHRAYNNKPAETADALAISFLLAQSLEKEPLLISQLVRYACFSISVRALEETLNRIALPRESLDFLHAVIARAENDFSSGDGLSRAFLGERAMILHALDNPADLQKRLGSADAAGAPSPAELAKVLKTDRAHIISLFDQLLAARASAFPARMERTAAVPDPKKSAPVASMLFPAHKKPVLREAHAAARARLALLAVALERFRADQNSYPADLAALTPKYIPAPLLDPFTGEPIGFSRTAAGYTLKSFGAPEETTAVPEDFSIATAPKRP